MLQKNRITSLEKRVKSLEKNNLDITDVPNNDPVPIRLNDEPLALGVTKDSAHYSKSPDSPTELTNKDYVDAIGKYNRSTGDFEVEGDITVGDDLYVGDNIFMTSDSAQIVMGVDNDESIMQINNQGVQLSVEDLGTNTTNDSFIINTTSAGTTAIGFGGAIRFGNEHNGGLIQDSMRLGTSMSGIIGGSESCSFTVDLVSGGTVTERMVLNHAGNLTIDGDMQVNGDDIKCDGAMNLEAQGGAITLDSSNGNFLAKKDGTEFSAANSAYAGMILGYTDIGLNETRVTYTMTTSYVVPTDEFGVTFIAPPSGNVEIFVQFGNHNSGGLGTGDLYAGLSTANATSGYAAVGAEHEERIIDGSGRNEVKSPSNTWTLTGLTAGTSYTRWVGVKSTVTQGTLEYGGSGTGHYPDFIMKATALPATITT